MNKKRFINPTKAKFISSIIIATIVATIVFFLGSKLIDRMIAQIDTQYRENSMQIYDGYSKAIIYCLENYKTALNAFNNDVLFKQSTTDEIHQYIQKYKYKNHPDISDIFYVDSNGKGYFQDGTSLPLGDREYYKTIMNEKKEIYISEPILSKKTNKPVFIISQKVNENDNSVKGVLCASISLTTLQRLLSGISIGNKGHIILLDQKGKFIYHDKENLLYQRFTPKDPKYSVITSETISFMREGHIITQDSDENTIELYFKKIPDTEWILGLSIPISQWEKLRQEQNFYKYEILFIAIISLVLLLIIEERIMHYFQKKELMVTIYDQLTNLWTRQKFEKEASKMLHHYPHSKFILIECDIRGFKFINQNYGEEKADKLLIYLSKHLKNITGTLNGIIGRGFADHFYILIKTNSIVESIKHFRSLIDKLNEDINQYEIPFFPKFGISFYTANKNETSSIQNLIGQASFAKSTIKDNVISQFSVYNSRLVDKINEERFIESHMEQALKNNEFFVLFQPKIDLASDGIAGAEALVRWKNSELGIITPDKFIPLFEKNGFITKLDFYVYDLVFKFLQKCIDEKIDVVPISVNMSRNHNKPVQFIYDFMNLFNKYTIPPNLIEIEILERSVMDNEALCKIVELLHNEGFLVAMDDFGSGESSLNMLTKIPVDILKFDRDFLLSSTDQNGNIFPSSKDFIKILVDLSKTLNKKTIFEGVETEKQRDFLRSINCDQVQGYFYSKPLTEKEYLSYVEKKYFR